jgi:2-polyprenyl-3-methyl-5-hydroxy-6-metoxy-1,4-benzoquinol methylase
MNPAAMSLYGRALLDYYNGDKTAELIIRRDDGLETVLPVGIFFRVENELQPGEVEAINQSRGQVLDIGAGSGIHTLILQSRGFTVTAIDINSNAVNIMIQRGILDVHCADIMNYQGGPFDTLLMFGHGIGMVETISGFNHFLDHAASLLRPNGQLIISSVDVRRTNDPVHLEYHKANSRAGRYIGETRIQFEYKGERGPFCGWLHIDPDTLQEVASLKNWKCEIIFQDKNGEYFARLIHKGSV